MRSRTFRVLALVMLSTAAGCESGTEPRPLPDGFLGTWDGDRFQGAADVYVRDAELQLLGWEENGRADVIGVRIHITDFDGPGRYSLDAGEAEVTYLLGGDAISARYATKDAGAGTLVVDRVENGRMSGTVRFDAEVASHAGPPPTGNRGRFEGAFEAAVKVPPR